MSNTMKSDSEFMKEVQKAGAFENEPNDRHYTLCPECGCGTDDVTVSKFGMCVDCYNPEVQEPITCNRCEKDTYVYVDFSHIQGGMICESCYRHEMIIVLKDEGWKEPVEVDYGALELNDPMPAHWQERADELGCTVALVKYIDELETRVRFLEDLPTLKAEGLVE